MLDRSEISRALADPYVLAAHLIGRQDANRADPVIAILKGRSKTEYDLVLVRKSGQRDIAWLAGGLIQLVAGAANIRPQLSPGGLFGEQQLDMF